MSLRVCNHPRGHVASCNGKIHEVNARIEHCDSQPGNAVQMAALVESVAFRESELKATNLAHFQERVKKRVYKREREKQQEVAVASRKTVQSEQRVTDQAIKVDRSKVHKSVEVAPDVEDIRVMASARQHAVVQQSLSTQTARKSLLAQQVTIGNISSLKESKQSQFQHLEPFGRDATASSIIETRSVPVKQDKHRSSSSALRKFTAPLQIELAQKKQAGMQYLVFRRLYSDLEREQARQRQLRKTHFRSVKQLKKQKEACRRAVEDEVDTMDSFSTVSTEALEEEQRAEEWLQLMALEERKQQLQRAKEMERYTEALKQRLKEKLSTQHASLPPVCSCANTFRDTNPDTCANNCIFYKNPKAYAKALSNLLQSLE